MTIREDAENLRDGLLGGDPGYYAPFDGDVGFVADLWSGDAGRIARLVQFVLSETAQPTPTTRI